MSFFLRGEKFEIAMIFFPSSMARFFSPIFSHQVEVPVLLQIFLLFGYLFLDRIGAPEKLIVPVPPYCSRLTSR